MSRFDAQLNEAITFNSALDAISAATSRALDAELKASVDIYSLAWALLTHPGNPTAVMDCLGCLP